MKTRTLNYICISLVVASVILLSVSCDNESIRLTVGHFTYEGTQYTLDNGFLEDNGATNGSYNFILAAGTSGIDFNTGVGTGHAYSIEFFSPTSTLAVGTYTMIPQGDPGYMDPNTVGHIAILIDCTVEGWGTEPIGDYYEAVSGTITIHHVDSIGMDLEFNVVLDNGKSCTGIYNGTLTFK